MLAILAVIFIICAVFSHFGGFGTGECANTEEFAKYASDIFDIEIPEGTKIVALGEATHGNAEFQQLKLDVFKILVEKYGIRGFALEGDYGGCEYANRYINGGEGTAREAAEAIGFAIYRTDEMAELFDWMREYNEKAGQGERIVFYGFDMQRIEYNYLFMLENAESIGCNVDELAKIWNYENHEFSNAYTPDERMAIIESVKAELLECDEHLAAEPIHCADILIQNRELGKIYENNGGGNKERDMFMAENVKWALEQEEERGNNALFISAHNGHIEQTGTYGIDAKVMGNILADTYGDGYYAIGTDFYKTKNNIPNSKGKRKNYIFYSYDPLAKASKKCGYDMSYLDFSKVDDGTEIKNIIDNYTWNGSLGEGYSILMEIIPYSYRVYRCPGEMYDSMIFVSDAHPIKVLDPVMQ